MPRLLYKTYLFKDKDPAIDRLRTAITRSKLSYEQIEDASGVRVATLHSWFSGKVRTPRHATMAAVVGALGLKWGLVRARR